MWRVLHIVAIGALLASAVYAYGIKYRTIYAAEQIVKIKHRIDAAKDQIVLLRAEYAHLARPDRISRLADKLLDLQPTAINQIVKPEALPDPQPKQDLIGRKLDALVASQGAK